MPNTHTPEGRERRLRHLEAVKEKNKEDNIRRWINKQSVSDNIPGPDSDPCGEPRQTEYTFPSFEEEVASWDLITKAGL